MPSSARLKKDDPDEPEWGITEELMAQMVETVSVFAADRRLAKPRVIPRPGELGTQQQQDERKAEQAASHGGLLTAAAMMGKVVRT